MLAKKNLRRSARQGAHGSPYKPAAARNGLIIRVTAL